MTLRDGEAGAAAPSQASASASALATPLDPHEEMRRKRELRRQLRELGAQAQALRQQGGTYDAQNVIDVLESTEALRLQVKDPREAMLDLRNFGTAVDLGVQLTRSMKTRGVGFDVDEYVQRVAHFIGGTVRGGSGGSRKRRNTRGGDADGDDDDAQVDDDDLDAWNWQHLGMIAAKYSRRAPTMDHLVGPLAVEAKERKVTKRARLEDDPGKGAEPDTLNESEIQRSENETTRLVQQIANLLQMEGGDEGVNLFRFAINPKSFSNSVENLFYISFLVRDGLVSIDDETDDPPTILRCEPPSEEDYAKGLKKRQIVLELNKATWRSLIEAYDIKECLIPHRRAASQPRQGGWYG